jgi:arylsulfatase A-like enzyme
MDILPKLRTAGFTAIAGAIFTHGQVFGESSKSAAAASEKPNVLFIVIDDLNDWIGCLGGHPQAVTPNIDHLASRGILFTNAHCNAPICNPSRVSLFTGIRPSTSHIHGNDDNFRTADSPVSKVKVMPQHFTSQGYATLGCGKLFHASKGQKNFETYGPANGQGPLPKKRLNCPESASSTPLWDWGVFPKEEGAEYNDIADATWTSDRLGKKSDLPMFLACGFYRPHVPMFAPQRFFDLYPLDEVKLPEVLSSDRDDISEHAFKICRSQFSPSHEWFVKSGKWQQAVQSYLACVSFTDDNVGTVIRALDAGPHADNTWIVLFSDHGFFLGEKQHWAKQSLWERATKVPLIIVPPKRLADRYAIGKSCAQPVTLVDLYPTLVEACGVESPAHELEGHSLIPLLKDPEKVWPHPAVTTHLPGNHAVRDIRYRYLHYSDGSEELYDHETDPNEWNNLAFGVPKPVHAEVIARLKKHLPQESPPQPQPK